MPIPPTLLLRPSSCPKGTDSRGTPSPPSQRPRRGDGKIRRSGPWAMARPNSWFKRSVNAVIGDHREGVWEVI
ncbi:hypothetical protein PAXINDRAFT_103952 [Paxillus involutus ATCC 200175]|uniref:Uncharacterized protein n=1 Tax=Paxillus involutus ATCC 200175 TaxID=664439 RepID=A0A0C9SLT2_PAXIN|nr:hypothetical protein PAXINDRAFT_103952 [Paxillus involutus ATCC 200175]